MEASWEKTVKEEGYKWINIFDKGHRNYNGEYGNGNVLMVNRIGNIVLTNPSYADILNYLEKDKK